jgi:hypothetical protein
VLEEEVAAAEEERDPGHLEDAAAAEEVQTEKPYDPTADDDWPGAQQWADGQASDDAAAQQ